jgi:hypothetical protein
MLLLTTRSVIGVGVLAIGCSLGIGASSAQAQVLGSVSPAPVYSYPAQSNFQPSRNYSYYDQNGVEYDSRYPHWSFDYNLWVQLNIK